MYKCKICGTEDKSKFYSSTGRVMCGKCKNQKAKDARMELMKATGSSKKEPVSKSLRDLKDTITEIRMDTNTKLLRIEETTSKQEVALSYLSQNMTDYIDKFSAMSEFIENITITFNSMKEIVDSQITEIEALKNEIHVLSNKKEYVPSSDKKEHVFTPFTPKK